MSKPVSVVLEHEKSLDDLRARIDENIDELTSGIAGSMSLKVERQWEGDTLNFQAKAMFQKLTGTIEMFPQHVRITVNLPDMLAPMAEKIAEKLQKKGGMLLEDKRSA
ncbi:MAG: polyhydroxyalkanoic acid system family protein [Pseudomonadota bacterium]